MTVSYKGPQSTGSFTQPFGIASGDFNKDGAPDLVVANVDVGSGGGDIDILLNNGHGFFSAGAIFPLASYGAFAVTTADLNGDGISDIIATGISNNGAKLGDGNGIVSVLLSNATGGFTQANYAAGKGAYAVTVADLDGDGHSDVIVANQGGYGVTVLKNTGDNTFTTFSSTTLGTGTAPSLSTSNFDVSGEVVTGDFDGDGKLDVAVADYINSKLFVLHGKGAGGFNNPSTTIFDDTTTITLDGAPFSLATGDLNGDNKLDLVVGVNGGGGRVETLINTSTPGSTSFVSGSTFSAGGAHPQSLVLADLDNDPNHTLDLVVVNETTASRISVFTGNGDGTFTPNGGPPFTIPFDSSQFTSAKPYTAAVADFDRDGKPDVAVTDANNGDLSIFETTACFLPGTLIRTPSGDVPIETLKAGDALLLASGECAPLRWLAKQTVATRFADPLRAYPVRVRAGALGENVPARDLLLSPDHALFLNGVLVQAGALVNGTSIVRETAMPERFTYYNLELAEHAVILAEGAAAETFVDNIGRNVFDNAAEHAALYPDAPWITEMEVPRAKSARQVPAALRQSLAARAADFGLMPAVAAA